MSSDRDARLRTAEYLALQGELESAIEACESVLNEEPQDLAAALLLGRLQLTAGNGDAVVLVARQLVEREPSAAEEVAAWGWALAKQQPDVGYQLVKVAADRAAHAADWVTAAAVLQEFVTRVPGHVPALVGLVDVARSGQLEATLDSAMAELVDRYLADGAGDRARALAAELVTREPWVRLHVERLRRALTMLGESDPGAVIVDPLGEREPFIGTDHALDVPRDKVNQDSVLDEVDRRGGRGGDRPVPAAEQSSARRDRPKDVLSVSGDGSGTVGREADEYARGRALHRAGRIDECISVLTDAWRTSSARFHAAALLGSIYQGRQQVADAIQWLERAASVAAPEAEDRHLVLYHLAEVLETAGEPARALAVYLELQVDAGVYRDVAERVSRLAARQSRG